MLAVTLYLFSLAFAPQPTTPTKPVVFADWLSGISPPDQNIVNKHVHDMVEVSKTCIFKSYLISFTISTVVSTVQSAMGASATFSCSKIKILWLIHIHQKL